MSAFREGSVVREGYGLHTGAPVRVVLEPRRRGGVFLCAGSEQAEIAELSVASTNRATTVEACGGHLRIATIEHALAALAGLAHYGGLAIHVDGPEMPLLGGGAREWCEALGEIDLATAAVPPMRIARRAVLHAGASTYEFVPGEATDIAVRVDFDDPRLAPVAAWHGDPRDFRDRIAPARTFAFERDLGELVRSGLARHVAPEAVVVVTPGAILSAGAPFAEDEPARHKLLDLLGDLYLHGGVPLGALRAVRPGHAANARIFAQARAEGVLVPEPLRSRAHPA
ncbi:MAG TPA: UDP-3-O-acyl-N-acetylglucosamine deacetylase [Polyangiaceae bacterium]|nr:UDP-3-O-acyl-N-acetylglucosamine deacetylase [Polyangiaceae bacterium]